MTLRIGRFHGSLQVENEPRQGSCPSASPHFKVALKNSIPAPFEGCTSGSGKLMPSLTHSDRPCLDFPRMDIDKCRPLEIQNISNP